MAVENDNLDNKGGKPKGFSITWQIVVFPAMTAFFILAAYGFYLIYNLVGDVHRIADSVGINMSIMAGQMQQVTLNLDELTGSVHSISVNLDDLTVRVRDMSEIMEVMSGNVETLQPMLSNLVEMKLSMQQVDDHLGSMIDKIDTMNNQVANMTNLMGSMTSATHQITHGVTGLNQNIGRPMSFMNSFAPW